MSIARLSILILSLFTLTACAPALIVAGAGTVAVVAQERSASEAFDDAALQVEVKGHLLDADEALFRKVNVEVVERRVMLVGIVPSANDRVDAARVAWQTAGVREVINELQVSDQGRLKSFGSDAWISTQLKTKLIGDEKVRRLNFNIETVAGTVYVLGVARSSSELQRVIGHAKSIGGVRDVVTHVEVRASQSPTF